MELRNPHVKRRMRNASAAAIGGVSAGAVMLALVLLAGALAARLIIGVGLGGLRFEQRHRTSAANS